MSTQAPTSESILEDRLRQVMPRVAHPMSMAEKVAMLDETERIKMLYEIAPTAEDMERLLYTWNFWARPNQMEPEGAWQTWALFSGRGFGKTRAGAEAVIKRARFGPFYPIALVGQTKSDVRDTMVEVFESSIMRISSPKFMPKLETSKRRVSWPNGMIAIMYSGDEPDQLRGPQHGFGWLDEIAKFQYPDITWANFSLGLRLGPTPQCVITTTPRPIPLIKKLFEDNRVTKTFGSTYDNASNLPATFLEEMLRRYEGTRLGGQELHGKMMGDVEGAMWSRDQLEKNRVFKLPHIVRVIIAVDPSAGATGDYASETGIIVAGYGDDGHAYILQDATVQSNKPEVWGSEVVAAYHRFAADAVVAETNMGGEMVRYTLQTIDANLPVIKVTASRNKQTRAEPVSSLYSQGRVHHLGLLPLLEDELCSWVPGDSSPDRLDACVWAITELILKNANSMTLEQLAGLFQWN